MVQMLLPVEKGRRVSEPDSDGFRGSTRRAVERSSSVNFDDIPKELVVEILCRLPSAEFVCRCKVVSKTWCTLISDPYFIGRFLWLQREKKTAVLGNIINEYGDELFHDTKQVNLDSKNLLKNLMKRVPRVRHPRVLATWNDLVLCSTYHEDLCEYHIGNPRTMQLVSLPPTRRYDEEPGASPEYETAVGFICEPYYEEKEDSIVINESDIQQESEERKVIETNFKYKFKVVRILPTVYDSSEHCFKCKIQVFSSETGEWRNSLASCRKGFDFDQLVTAQTVACSGMLYWKGLDGDIFGLGPLMVNNKSSATAAANGDNYSSYQFHVIEFDQLEADYASSCFRLQSHRGCLQMVDEVCYVFPNIIARQQPMLLLWELKEEELEQMAVQGGGKLGRKHRRTYKLLDQELLEDTTGPMLVSYEYLDPNDFDACMVCRVTCDDLEIGNAPRYYKCNIHTGKIQSMMKSKLFGGKFGDGGCRRLQFRFTWWPTPVPIISGNEEQVAAVIDLSQP